MKFLLDTDICVYLINARPQKVQNKLIEHESEGVAISVITLSELYFGVAKSVSKRNLLALEKFLSGLRVLDFNAQAAQVYGDVRSHLEACGTPIGPLDTQIAAHALAMQMVLVTNNEHEFRRVPNLIVENWAA